ncbi:MAG: AI-2E family transporter [Chloroflexi bacterium]|nr:AI-2E family transporter [Chloroflexota bacterium]MDA8188264.1 AI-2E family transporter [Dehalococcoidales bacterium]
MERDPWLRALIVLLVIIAVIYLFGLLWSTAMIFSDIIMLFFMSWLVAFILKPLARFLNVQGRLPRLMAVGIVFAGFFLAIAIAGIIMVPVIGFQLAQLSTNLPRYAKELPSLTNLLQADLQARGINVELSQWYQNQDLPTQIQRLGTLVIQNSLSLIAGVASMIFAVIIVLILSFYIMLDGDRIVEQIIGLVPEQYRKEAHYLLDSIDRSFGGFLRGQVIQAIAYGLGTAFIMWIAGLNYVLLATTFSVIVMIIPFFGPFLALVPPLAIAVFQLSPSELIAVVIAFLVLQQVVLNIVAPKVMSDSVGIHPLLVFFAILVGGKIAGVGGAIFGVPVVGVINAMALYFIRKSNAESSAYSESGVKKARSARSPSRRQSEASWRRGVSGLRGAIGKFLLRGS